MSIQYQIDGYEILDLLGEGSSGQVFKSRQKSMNRIVALKILNPALAQDENFQRRFIEEAKTCAKFSNRHIVQAIDVGKTNDGIFYFVMEYVDGKTVFQILEEEGILGEVRTRDIMTQIAKALQYTHKRNFVHRDVKPDNIMINKLGVAKLCDLGLAKRIGAKEAITGTPYYISPEQVRGEPVDIRSDIYSLGASAYHMGTGRVPFEGDPAVAMSRHLTETVVPPQNINSCLSPQFNEIVMKMMEKDPTNRYANPTELLDSLAIPPSKSKVSKKVVSNLKKKYRASRRRRF